MRYLPLLNGNHDFWRDRPDLFLLARMDASDKVEDAVVEQVYQTMRLSTNDSSELNSFEQTIERRHVRKNIKYRVFAGQVLLGIVRISASTNQPTSLAKAIQLSAFNQYKFSKKSTTENYAREARKGFSDFRNTAHLQAAMVYRDPAIDDIEGSEHHTTRFLSRARGFELFIDNNLGSPSFKWDPWRVPGHIPYETAIELPQLTAEERRVLNLS